MKQKPCSGFPSRHSRASTWTSIGSLYRNICVFIRAHRLRGVRMTRTSLLVSLIVLYLSYAPLLLTRPGPAPMNAAGHGPYLAWPCQPDSHGRQRTAPDGDPEGQGIAPGGVVQRAGHPRPDGPTQDGRQHQRAEDGSVVRALENLSWDSTDNPGEP